MEIIYLTKYFLKTNNSLLIVSVLHYLIKLETGVVSLSLSSIILTT